VLGPDYFRFQVQIAGSYASHRPPSVYNRGNAASREQAMRYFKTQWLASEYQLTFVRFFRRSAAS
jgi:hypothetical protein